MALVQGEDSESDEEINTEQLQSLVLTPDGSIRGYHGLIKSSFQQKTAGIVMGEESETDEEEDQQEEKEGSGDQTDAGWEQVKAPLVSSQASSTSTQESPRAESLEPLTTAPQSLLHKKLREKNQSLRRNIIDRILKLYSVTCRNLTLVNNNLSKAQGTIETVNSNLKRSEHELSDLNSILHDINLDARSLAPRLSGEHLTTPKKTPPSPLRHRLLKGFSSWGTATATVTSKKATPSELEVPEAHPNIPEARPWGKSSGEKVT